MGLNQVSCCLRTFLAICLSALVALGLLSFFNLEERYWKSPLPRPDLVGLPSFSSFEDGPSLKWVQFLQWSISVWQRQIKVIKRAWTQLKASPTDLSGGGSHSQKVFVLLTGSGTPHAKVFAGKNWLRICSYLCWNPIVLTSTWRAEGGKLEENQMTVEVEEGVVYVQFEKKLITRYHIHEWYHCRL